MECVSEKNEIVASEKKVKISQPNFAEMLINQLYDSAEGKVGLSEIESRAPKSVKDNYIKFLKSSGLIEVEEATASITEAGRKYWKELSGRCQSGKIFSKSFFNRERKKLPDSAKEAILLKIKEKGDLRLDELFREVMSKYVEATDHKIKVDYKGFRKDVAELEDEGQIEAKGTMFLILNEKVLNEAREIVVQDKRILADSLKEKLIWQYKYSKTGNYACFLNTKENLDLEKEFLKYGLTECISKTVYGVKR
ncbi:MAG: hypothetical protein KBT11_11240 [Treponema sp.]|nr:hypothetical protein [Candidatus Treponema equifaecale]